MRLSAADQVDLALSPPERKPMRGRQQQMNLVKTLILLRYVQCSLYIGLLLGLVIDCICILGMCVIAH